MSKLAKIKEKLAALLEIEVKMATIKTDKAVLSWDGDEDLKAGDKVYVQPDEEGAERVPAENGEYVTEDGKIIVVADGAVDSITDPVAEVDEDDKADDVDENIESADETADEKPAEEGDKPAEETEKDAIAKIREEIDELYKLVDSILDKIGESRREADERFKKIEKMAETTTIAEEFEKLNEVKKTGDSKVDKFIERFGNK